MVKTTVKRFFPFIREPA